MCVREAGGLLHHNDSGCFARTCECSARMKVSVFMC